MYVYNVLTSFKIDLGCSNAKNWDERKHDLLSAYLPYEHVTYVISKKLNNFVIESGL